MARAGGIAGVIAEGIKGYLTGQRIEEDKKERESERSYRDEQRGFLRQEQQTKLDEKRQLAAAGAPVAVEVGAGGAILPETMDNRDVGQPGEAPVQQNGGIRVAGKTYADRGLADIAAAEANSPAAVAQRQAAALRGMGRTLEAAQLEAATTQNQTAKFQLEKGQEEFIEKKWNDRVSAITKVDDLTGVLSGSPLVGGAQVKAVTSPDGKSVQLVKVGQDGSETTFGKAFSNDTRGVQEAILAHSKGLPVTAKISALQGFEQFDLQKKTQADNVDYQNRNLEQNADQFGRRMDQSNSQFEQTMAQRNTEFAANKDFQNRQLAQSAAQHSASHSIQLKRLGMDQATHARAMAKAAADDKIPSATRDYLASLSKQIDAKAKAIDEARLKPEWDGASQGAQAVMGELNALMRKQQDLLRPYMEKDATKVGATKGATYEEKYGNGGKSTPTDGKNSPPADMGGSVVRQPDGSWAPAGVAGKRSIAPPAPATPAVPQQPAQPDIPQGVQLDQARAQAQAAVQALQSWGMVQRKRDPQGYAQAQAQAEQARLLEQQAEAEWQKAVQGQSRPAMVAPSM